MASSSSRPRAGVKNEAKPVLHPLVEPGQYTSFALSEHLDRAGIAASIGSIGDAYDNALMESCWSRVQVELLGRQTWSTRVELATALFEYLEIFHNRQRRHSSLGMLTPIDFESMTT